MVLNGNSLLKSASLALVLSLGLPLGGLLAPAPAQAATLPAPYLSRALDAVLIAHFALVGAVADAHFAQQLADEQRQLAEQTLRDWRLTLNSSTETRSKAHWPHALNLLRTLLGQQTLCQHAWKNRVWTWQRNP